MTSQNRINANRRNALKSTGPRSASGKFRVHYNALWHGAFAKNLLLPDEDSRSFSDLRRKLRRHYRPADEEEEIIVNRILLAAWRLQRLAAMETRVLRARVEAAAAPHPIQGVADFVFRRDELPPDELPPEPVDPGPRDPIAVAWIQDSGGNTLVKLARYQYGLERSFYRAIQQLERRRAPRHMPPAA